VENGVKQGDVLSPILFNLHINSIVDDLEKAKTDPVIVGT
jgi:retron-type reverse transcriptase